MLTGFILVLIVLFWVLIKLHTVKMQLTETNRNVRYLTKVIENERRQSSKAFTRSNRDYD